MTKKAISIEARLRQAGLTRSGVIVSDYEIYLGREVPNKNEMRQQIAALLGWEIVADVYGQVVVKEPRKKVVV